MASSRSAALFDLDGVIVDSRAHHMAAWVQLAREHGIQHTAGFFRETFGLRNDAILSRLIAGISDDDAARMADRKEALFREAARGALKPLPGVRELLHALDAAGVVMAVVTATPRENLDMVLETLGIAGRFGALVAAEDTARGKPDPEGFLLAAARLGAAPDHSTVIEDAPAGIAAAKAAGMQAIGVTTTHPAADLADADLVVESLAEEEVRLHLTRPR